MTVFNNINQAVNTISSLPNRVFYKKLNNPSIIYDVSFSTITIPRPKNYIQPLCDIFSSIGECIEYAKRRVISALKTKKPYEHSVVIDERTRSIAGEYKGNAISCPISDNNLNCLGSYIIVHGHPTQFRHNGAAITNPVSFQDAILILSKSFYKEIRAVNADGEFSSLRKKPNFRILSAKEVKYYLDIYDKFIKRIPKNKRASLRLEKIYKEIFSDIKDFSNCKNVYEYNLKLGVIKDKNKKLYKEIKSKIPKNKLKEIAQLEKIIIYPDINTIKVINQFWQRYADEMGFVYKSTLGYV